MEKMEKITEAQYKNIKAFAETDVLHLIAKQLILSGIDTTQKAHAFCFRNEKINSLSMRLDKNNLYNAFEDILKGLGGCKADDIPDINL